MKRLVLALLSAQVACGPSLSWRWAAGDVLRPPEAARYPDKPAVYLLKERRILMVSRWGSPSYTQWQEHDVIAILNERGFAYANVAVPYRADAQVIAFSARTISPGGEAQPVDPTRTFDDDARRGKSEGDQLKVRVFSFSNVKVGDILEYQYTIESSRIASSWWEFTNSELPVNKYVLELEGTPDIIYRVNAYNTHEGWVKGESRGNWTLTWTMADIPASVSESLAPAREDHDPWWLFTIKQFSRRGVVVNVDLDWNTAFRRRADSLYFENDAFYAGFAFDADRGATQCADAACKLERAAEAVRRALTFTGFSTSTSRTAKEIVESGRANGYEKARVLWQVLARAGIEAKFAFVNRALERSEDRDAPHSEAFNHVVLWLPEQPGLAGPRWVDPSCEYCLPGQIPVWLTGAEALVLKADKPVLGQRVQVEAAFEKVSGEEAPGESVNRRIEVTLSPGGDASADLEIERVGRELQDERTSTRLWNPEDWTKDSEKLVSGIAETARLEDPGRYDFLASATRARRRIRFVAPGYATLDGPRTLVPLKLLGDNLGSWLGEGDGKRKLDVVVTRPYRREQSLVVRIPVGYRVESLPEPAKASHGLFEFEAGASAERDRVTVTRRFSSRVGRAPKEEFGALRDVLKAYDAQARNTLVLVRDAAPSARPE
jgi:hypothetical protein